MGAELFAPPLPSRIGLNQFTGQWIVILKLRILDVNNVFTYAKETFLRTMDLFKIKHVGYRDSPRVMKTIEMFKTFLQTFFFKLLV